MHPLLFLQVMLLIAGCRFVVVLLFVTTGSCLKSNSNHCYEQPKIISNNSVFVSIAHWLLSLNSKYIWLFHLCSGDMHKSIKMTWPMDALFFFPLRSAWVWGTSVKHNPQKVGLDHRLNDEDVVQIVKRYVRIERSFCVVCLVNLASWFVVLQIINLINLFLVVCWNDRVWSQSQIRLIFNRLCSSASSLFYSLDSLLPFGYVAMSFCI